MKIQDRVKRESRETLWQEYCGFLDMSMDEYMYTQRRLMEEQIHLWRESGLGRQLLNGARPETLEELRQVLPLTTYEDYADVLLAHRADMLCAQPAV